ncbi:MAG: asparagine synthase (glutamine-hydrolyzing) [Cyclobacteriaceae bacterium]|nr:asparagine synthase (glutamine-hydrolyzing) [Cyclobacteriaceae bacterium]
MCGITGIFAFNQVGRFNMINLSKATSALEKRGPDNHGVFNDEMVGLGHRRLSIIDTSIEANQPMTDASGRYKLVFNGEIYNYKNLRNQLKNKGVSFANNSDTEVLLYSLIKEGSACISKLNGFFAFAFYDTLENTLLLARDRFGIKPLHIYQDADKLLFASEVKSLLAYGIDKKLNYNALHNYLQLNYLPGAMSMFKGVYKLLPGQYLTIKNKKIAKHSYYKVKTEIENKPFEESKKEFQKILEQSVTDRLVSDVPLGTFLSGGVDSSVISAIAARHVDTLQTFSIGYKDEPYFDETKYANQVAKHIGSKHTVFKLTNDDLFAHLFDMLNYLDEPFADSSALAVYILSKETKKHVTVALSGDGADELFAGYNKHAALYKMLNSGAKEKLVSSFSGLWGLLPKSRNNPITNTFRQLDRFAKAAKMTASERYWAWAAIGDATYASSLIKSEHLDSPVTQNPFRKTGVKESVNDTLLADLNLVLPGDMLTKVDLMSMANSLEVRVPFLDHNVVDFAFKLPVESKINSTDRKRIIKETFKSYVPNGLFYRKKHGFEVPLLGWLKNELNALIQHDLLAPTFIEEQGVFNVSQIEALKKQLHSRNPEDAPAKVWALLVFQWWWKKYFVS